MRGCIFVLFLSGVTYSQKKMLIETGFYQNKKSFDLTIRSFPLSLSFQHEHLQLGVQSTFENWSFDRTLLSPSINNHSFLIGPRLGYIVFGPKSKFNVLLEGGINFTVIKNLNNQLIFSDGRYRLGNYFSNILLSTSQLNDLLNYYAETSGTQVDSKYWLATQEKNQALKQKFSQSFRLTSVYKWQNIQFRLGYMLQIYWFAVTPVIGNQQTPVNQINLLNHGFEFGLAYQIPLKKKKKL